MTDFGNSLHGKLRSAVHATGSETSSKDSSNKAESEVIAALRRLVSRVDSPVPATRHHGTSTGRSIESVVDGSFVDTPHGPLFVSTILSPLEMSQGLYGPGFSCLKKECPPLLAKAGGTPQLDGKPFTECLFFDTETTGLGTTSGTYAFLIGLGYVEKESFVVEQLYMRDFEEEAALLWVLADRFSRFDTIVSYNGRAFDVPLLKARFITNRVFEPPIPPHHLDLLFPARRLWSNRGGGCRLSYLESAVLGLEREGDVPGHLIPSIYFESIYRNDASGLEGVFYHNQEDIRSLAALTILSASLLTSTDADSDSAGDIGSPFALGEDLLGAARLFEELEHSEAIEKYRMALQCRFANSNRREETLCRIGRLYRRRGRITESMESYREVAEVMGDYRPFALIEMAKFFEHQQKEYEYAYTLASQALQQLCDPDSSSQTSGIFSIKKIAVEHRLKRLKARMAGRPWRGTEPSSTTRPETDP